MNILVCITHVPDTTSKISFIDQNTKLNTAGLQYIIGSYDDYALARAVELRDQIAGSTITVLTVGLSETEATLRKALAIGADQAVRINIEPIDSWLVASQIAGYAKDKNYDLILTGRESIDYNGGVVHGILAGLLGLPAISPVMKLDIEGNTAKMQREIEGGKENIEANLPFVAGCQEPIAEWKIANMRGIMSAKTKPLTVIEPYPTQVLGKNLRYELPPAKGACQMIDASKAEELIDLLRQKARVI